jgi:TetR/AcrR family transcriptional regulator, regulator of autoinduction and epiphytic fitness
VTILVNMIHMLKPLEVGSQRRASILNAAIPVFGRFGFKKASVDDLAKAAKISKQGLYLHFSSKEEVFVETVKKYLDDGLGLVEQQLARRDAPLFDRLLGAMDGWFGRHLATFNPHSYDVIEASDRLSGSRVEEYKSAFQSMLRKALADSPEFTRAKNICTPREVSQVLFLCGLTWKEGHASRADFMKKIGVCIRVCCQIG